MSVGVIADEQEVFSLERRQVGRFALGGHQAAQHLSQDAGHPAAGHEYVGLLEIENEDTPRVLPDRLNLAYRAVARTILGLLSAKFVRAPFVREGVEILGTFVDGPLQGTNEQLMNERSLVLHAAEGAFDLRGSAGMAVPTGGCCGDVQRPSAILRVPENSGAGCVPTTACILGYASSCTT